MVNIEKFLSKNERIIEESANNYLTNNRLMKFTGSGKNFRYKELQLDKIDSFEYSKDFNTSLALIGFIMVAASAILFVAEEMASIIIGPIGFMLVMIAYATATTKYVARSTSGTKIALNSSANSMNFWKAVNEQKNN